MSFLRSKLISDGDITSILRTIGGGGKVNGQTNGNGGDGERNGRNGDRNRNDTWGGGGGRSTPREPFPINGPRPTWPKENLENASPTTPERGPPRTPRRSLGYGVRFSLPPEIRVEDTDTAKTQPRSSSPVIPTRLRTASPTRIEPAQKPAQTRQNPSRTQRSSEGELSDSSADVFYPATEICHATEIKSPTPTRRKTVAAGARDDASLVSFAFSDTADDTSSFCSSWATSVASACSDSSGSTATLTPVRPPSPTASVAGSIVSVLPLPSESHTSPFVYAAGRRTVLFEEMLLHAQSCVANRKVQAQLEVCKVKFAYYNECSEGKLSGERIVAAREKYFGKVRSLARREGGAELQRHLDGLEEQFKSVNL